MATNTAGQGPSPDHFFSSINSYQLTEALRGAIELDVFTAIGEGNTDVAAIARRTAASPKGIRVLCDYLTVTGFLHKQNGKYGLTQDSAVFLDRRSPASLGGTVKFLLSPGLRDKFLNIADVVRKGGTLEGQGTVEPDNPVWRDFARSMVPLMAMPAEMIAKALGSERGEKWKVLDIAAGHGLFGISIAKLNPNAEIVALDWPAVLEVAKEHAEAAGVSGRYRLLPGSAFEVDFGSGYDVVLLTNFLHHFDAPTCEGLLKKVHAALKPGGRAATLEFVPNEDRVSPPVAATFAMMMLASTASGDAYTFRELEQIFSNAGFARSESRPLLPGPQTLVMSHK